MGSWNFFLFNKKVAPEVTVEESFDEVAEPESMIEDHHSQRLVASRSDSNQRDKSLRTSLLDEMFGAPTIDNAEGATDQQTNNDQGSSKSGFTGSPTIRW